MPITRCAHCQAETRGGNYLPGHDAKHVAILVSAVMGGHISLRKALAEIPATNNRLWTKVTDRLERNGYYQRIEALRAAMDDETYGASYWINSAYWAFGRQIDADCTTDVHKASAVLAYFQTTDYKPTTNAREIRDITLRRAS